MERIKLSKEERLLYFRFAKRNARIPEGMSEEKFNYAAISLHKKGLAFIDLQLNGVKSASLTKEGRAYLAVNPKLRNPFPWDTIMKAATLIAAVAATAALFISCCRLLMMR